MKTVHVSIRNNGPWAKSFINGKAKSVRLTKAIKANLKKAFDEKKVKFFAQYDEVHNEAIIKLGKEIGYIIICKEENLPSLQGDYKPLKKKFVKQVRQSLNFGRINDLSEILAKLKEQQTKAREINEKGKAKVVSFSLWVGTRELQKQVQKAIALSSAVDKLKADNKWIWTTVVVSKFQPVEEELEDLLA